ncbi:hypothetical protein HRG_000826 [Hirsutella rhossiliensis]|uniref:Uncharacterized protein n=1 Tax=Hirsutella rhossiliensis TaxID=111463 RepID=A0A9P8N7I1_9HYPO|nr:uncharacterized protein HRG_00826 [Hirsutella rhossiliensis]KAH0968184.1 hypothetical protein HRG_00826 [Hirsutella rhossiliensis]
MGRGDKTRLAELRRCSPPREPAFLASTSWHSPSPLDGLDAGEPHALKASLVRGRYGRAATYVAVAVVANHIRRVLVPWLGQFVWHHAVVADMKLARSAPHALLEASLLDFAWADVGRWACQQAALSVLARAVMARRPVDGADARRRQRGPSVGRRARAPGGHEGDGDAAADDSHGQSSDMASDARCVLRLVAGLTLLERHYTESCWALAHVYATARLLLSTRPCDAAFLRRLVLESTPRARSALQAGLVLRWLYRSVSAATTTRWPRLVLLLACACCVGTLHILRHSGRYFILLEMSDMLVTFGWMALGMAVLMAWAVRDWARVWLRGHV